MAQNKQKPGKGWKNRRRKRMEVATWRLKIITPLVATGAVAFAWVAASDPFTLSESGRELVLLPLGAFAVFWLLLGIKEVFRFLGNRADLRAQQRREQTGWGEQEEQSR